MFLSTALPIHAKRPARPNVYRWIGTQCIFLVVLAAISALFWSDSGVSVLSGGLSSLVPSAYFAFRLLARLHETRPYRVLSAFYFNALVKILCSVGLLVLLAVQPGVHLLPLIGGFLIMSLAQSVIARIRTSPKGRWGA